jgi:hypothetical protein
MANRLSTLNINKELMANQDRDVMHIYFEGMVGLAGFEPATNPL